MKVINLLLGLAALAAFAYTGFTTVYAVASNISPVDGMTTALAYLFTGGCFGKVLLENISGKADE